MTVGIREKDHRELMSEKGCIIAHYIHMYKMYYNVGLSGDGGLVGYLKYGFVFSEVSEFGVVKMCQHCQTYFLSGTRATT